MLAQNNEFHKCVKSFANADNESKWQPQDLYRDLNESEAANVYADCFNGISLEYDPISEEDIPQATINKYHC